MRSLSALRQLGFVKNLNQMYTGAPMPCVNAGLTLVKKSQASIPR